jgi:hypothetical protein
MSGSAAGALRRALKAEFRSFAGLIEIEMREVREWASVTFIGERHSLTLRLEGRGAGAAMAQFRNGLEDRELDLGDHILIDIGVSDSREAEEVAEIALETLTVEAD